MGQAVTTEIKQKNLLYATAIHSLSCGPGPLHNDECSQCSEKMTSFEAYQEHVKSLHRGIWKYRCGHCIELFERKQDCLDHTSSVHANTSTVYRKSRKQVLKPRITDNDIDDEDQTELNCLL